MGTVPWPKEKEARLRKMWASGYSATLIGDEIDATRNAVIGKVHRLKLGARPTQHAKPHPIHGKTTIRTRARRPAPKPPVRVGNKIQIVVELSKSELRAMLRQAVLNTAGAA